MTDKDQSHSCISVVGRFMRSVTVSQTRINLTVVSVL